MTNTLTAPDFDPDLSDGTFTVIDRAGAVHRLPGIDGMSLMEILRAADMPVKATCGGAAACGTCHVYVAPGDAARLAGPGEEEQDQLDRLLHAGATSRLACQILWDRGTLDGLTVTLAPEE
jgi:ferredoxin, 2Fe-2S